ncbi:hypothetical protein LWI28_014079 [Acer negundo]|uniref:Uncharacterized protein n=1 Tax=Acer negundo TaxID=4023 RepID=A0AAD5NUL1_ACENE|nr:hypothetical protein LWI28_014079 [Acer negundo]
MAIRNQRCSTVSTIDIWITSIARVPLLTAAIHHGTRSQKPTSTTFNMAPCNQRCSTVSAIDTQITSSGSSSIALASKITKKKRRMRLDRLITSANGKLHVDFSSRKPIGPIGPNAKKFFNEVGIVVTEHAPLNVGKWDDIPEEQIQLLINRVLSKFDVDISRQSYIKDWMLWRMKMRFNGFQHKNARREAQDAKIMELMSKFASSKF